MSYRPHHLTAVAALVVAYLTVTVLNSAATHAGTPNSVRRAPAVTYSGAFEFEGIAGKRTGSSCRGDGLSSFGRANPGAQVKISERNAAGKFSTLAKGRLAKGAFVINPLTNTDGPVCRMEFRAKAQRAPATDSSVYLEVKGLFTVIQFPAADVADGRLGTWTCNPFDDNCALVVGG